jgi:hemerythrin
MASLVWSEKLNPTVDLINIHFNKIDECIRYITEDIVDVNRDCKHTEGLINQLEQLCQLHFKYEEQLLEGLQYPSVDELKSLHSSFIDTFESFKVGSGQCHTTSFINSFIKLRMDFVTNMNTETMKLCDFIVGSYM